MARFPRIDRLCPLGIDEQRRIAGHCDRCGHPVHALDAMDDRAREALLTSAAGPLCVSYRLPARRLAAIALTLVAGTAMADPPPLTLAPQAPSAEVSPAESATMLPLDQIIMVGGVDEPRSARWIDDSTLPELPMVERSTTAESR